MFASLNRSTLRGAHARARPPRRKGAAVLSFEEAPRRAAFARQATPSLLDKLYRVTRARMRAYANRKTDVQDTEVDEMVMGILTDTLDGTLLWHYETKPLLQHVIDSARYRVRDAARKRWRRGDEAPFEAVENEDGGDVSLSDRLVSGARTEHAALTVARCEIADQLVADLRARITGDRELEQFFDAMVNERAVTRGEIMEVTGMSARQYANARSRLNRIVLQLAPEIRDAVTSVFTNKEKLMKKPLTSIEMLDALADEAARYEIDEGKPTRQSRAAAARYRSALDNRLAAMRREDLAKLGAVQIERSEIRPDLLAMARDALVARVLTYRQQGYAQGFAHRKLTSISDDDLRTMIQDIEAAMEKLS